MAGQPHLFQQKTCRQNASAAHPKAVAFSVAGVSSAGDDLRPEAQAPYACRCATQGATGGLPCRRGILQSNKSRCCYRAAARSAPIRRVFMRPSRGRSPSRLGSRNLDWRYQFGDHRRQSAEASRRCVARILAHGLYFTTRHTLFSACQVRRHPAPAGQSNARHEHPLIWRAEFLCAAHATADVAAGQS
jgi:hypothetical protein